MRMRMKGSSVADITLIKSVLVCRRRERVVKFLVRDAAAFSQLSKIAIDGDWVNTYPHLVAMHSEASAILAAKAAMDAVNSVL